MLGAALCCLVGQSLNDHATLLVECSSGQSESVHRGRPNGRNNDSY